MLIAARARVAKFDRRRQNPGQAIAAKPLADLDAKWGGRLNNADRFVTNIYQSLKGS